MSDTPTMGHNSGLDPVLNPELLQAQWKLDHAGLLKRKADLDAAMKRFQAALPKGISSDADQGKAAEFVAQLKACAKSAEGEHTKAKAPYLACGRAADAFFKSIADDLTATAKRIEGMQTIYARARVEAERRRRQEEAERAAREAEEAAAAARRAEEARIASANEGTKIGTMFGLPVAPDPAAPAAPPEPPPSTEIQETAAIAEARAVETARAAAAPAIDLSRVRGSMGATASLRAKWEFRLVDITKVPAKYLLLNEPLVRAEVKAFKDKTDIPGVEVFDAGRVVSNAR